MGAANFRYDGKRVVVVGGATGMGAAVANTLTELGAEIIVLDVRDVPYPAAAIIHADLTDRASVDAALDQIEGPVFALFSCAGVMEGAAVNVINFVAHRHIIERLLADGAFEPGASVTLISSVVGAGWEQNTARALELLATPDWDAAVAWLEAHPEVGTYPHSKQFVSAYVTHRAKEFGAYGVRLNAVLPGPAATPFATGNEDVVLGFGQDYRDGFGHGPFEADEMGDILAFVGSRAARAIAGELISADLGHLSAAKLGLHPDPIVDVLLTI
jgi:NAD(P)-dependent dehydrogenase (short-subunit alcohol dehydrogenase family)